MPIWLLAVAGWIGVGLLVTAANFALMKPKYRAEIEEVRLGTLMVIVMFTLLWPGPLVGLVKSVLHDLEKLE